MVSEENGIKCSSGVALWLQNQVKSNTPRWVTVGAGTRKIICEDHRASQMF